MKQPLKYMKLYNTFYSVCLILLFSNSLVSQAGLYKAIDNNDLSKFKRNLRKYSKQALNTQRSTDNYTPLLYACSKGNLPIVEYILKKKIKYSLNDKYGNSPLLIALKYDQFEVASYLITNKLESSTMINNSGENVIMLTCMPSPLKRIGTLNISTEEQRLKMVQQFLKEGISLEDVSKEGNTALMYAAYLSNFNIFYELFINGADATIKQQNKKGDTALSVASIGGDLEIVKLLYERGATLDQQSYKNNTPLMNAIYYENWDIVNFLLLNNVDVSYISPQSYSAISMAVRRNNDTLVSELIKRIGMQIDLTTDHGNLLLALSVICADDKMESILFSNDINFNQINRSTVLADSIFTTQGIEDSKQFYNKTLQTLLNTKSSFQLKEDEYRKEAKRILAKNAVLGLTDITLSTISSYGYIYKPNTTSPYHLYSMLFNPSLEKGSKALFKVAKRYKEIISDLELQINAIRSKFKK